MNKCQICGAEVNPKRATYLSNNNKEIICLECAEKHTVKKTHKAAPSSAGSSWAGGREETPLEDRLSAALGISEDGQSAKGSTQSATKSAFGAYKGNSSRKKAKMQKPSRPREQDEFS